MRFSNSYDDGDRFRRSISGFGTRNTLLVVLLIVIIIGGGAIYTMGTVQIPEGYRGVLLTWGRVESDQPLNPGLRVIIPFIQSVELMRIQVQKAESTESSATKDLQEVSTTVAVNFKLRETKVADIYREIGQDFVSTVLKPNIEESLKAATAEFTAEELITLRPLIKARFDGILAEKLDTFYIDVVAVSLTDFQFSPTFTAAIEAKVVAEQSALEAKNKLVQIEYEAQQVVIEAEAEKNATIARSEGEAQAQIIEANATAKSITVITQQMTNEYAQYLWLSQWDGKLPLVVGEGEGIFIDLASLTDTTP